VSGQAIIQTPSKFCSSERAPNIKPETLAQLSSLNLGVPIENKNKTLENLEMTSQTDLVASSSMTSYDLNKTVEENEEIERNKKIKIA